MSERTLRVCVVGTGHIGLPLAAVLADGGFDVVGYDVNEDLISRVNLTAEAGFVEEGLDSLLRKHLHRRLRLTTSPPVNQDVYVITVGTPLHPTTHRPTLALVRDAIAQISPGFGDDPLVILRSTVTVGTTRNIVLPEIQRHAERFGLAFCPERTIEGRAISEMRVLPQIVGGVDDDSTTRADAFFSTITDSVVRVSSLEAAEMIKLINNCFRDVTFAFANEIALVAEDLGLDAGELVRAANSGYPRSRVARPGFVGGPCLEKDSLILIESVKRKTARPRAIAASRRTNEALVGHVANRVIRELRHLRQPGRASKVLLSGFAFKGRPATEDIRGSAAIPLMKRLQAAGLDVWGHDFVTPDKVIASLGARACTLEQGVDGAVATIIANDHPGYLEVGLPRLAARMASPAVLFDTCGLFSADDFRAVPDLRYAALGSQFTTR